MRRSYIGFLAAILCLETACAIEAAPDDEAQIRSMVSDAIGRLNKGDIQAVQDFWAEDADYVSVDGRLIMGRQAIQAFFADAMKAGGGHVHETVTIERVRFLALDLALVDGSWTVTGARDAAGREAPPIHGHGTEIVQKRNGRWRLVATREMVLYAGRSSEIERVRRELETVFAKRVQATKDKDVETLIALTSPDYSATLPTGEKLDYEQIKGYLRRGAEQFVTVRNLTITIEALSVNGKEAIVDARQRFARTQKLKDGKIHDVVTSVLQTETWVNTPQGWQLKTVADEREQTIMVDGKSF